jgi:3-deoxy-D-manno-octulosonate 8-phosphate phosphatase (KDO 8-P phosphatase)
MNYFQTFENNGGKFLVSQQDFELKLHAIKAFVFDWDGVFTDGGKDHEQQSSFNEADSMGTNLLRFSFFLKKGELPITAIISGENNKTAFNFVARENFDLKYFKVADKIKAIEHFCAERKISPAEVAYVFDDVLDLSIARICGLRVFIPREANPLLNNFVIKNNLADYITAATSGNCPVRETCELIIGAYGLYEEVLNHRIDYTKTYAQYVGLKKALKTSYFTLSDGGIKTHQI